MALRERRARSGLSCRGRKIYACKVRTCRCRWWSRGERPKSVGVPRERSRIIDFRIHSLAQWNPGHEHATESKRQVRAIQKIDPGIVYATRVIAQTLVAETRSRSSPTASRGSRPPDSQSNPLLRESLRHKVQQPFRPSHYRLPQSNQQVPQLEMLEAAWGADR